LPTRSGRSRPVGNADRDARRPGPQRHNATPARGQGTPPRSWRAPPNSFALATMSAI
jgi:hypothetical protein